VVLRYEWKVKNMQTEADRIRAKESGADGLTVGQATQLARNEQAIERIQEEMEDVEEALEESIRASIRGKREAADREAGGLEAGRKRKGQSRGKRGSDDEDGDGSSGGDDEDDFYDRTALARKKKAKLKAAAARGSGKRAVTVEELFGRKEALLDEARRLEDAILLEEAVVEEGGGKEGEKEGGEDPLDAFMSGMEASAEADKLKKLRAELAECQEEVAKAERLMKVADPDGWFRPEGSRKVGEAKAAAAAEMLATKQRKAAEEAARAAAEALQSRQAEASEPFVPEVEEEEEEEEKAASAPSPSAGTAPTEPPRAVCPKSGKPVEKEKVLEGKGPSGRPVGTVRMELHHAPTAGRKAGKRPPPGSRGLSGLLQQSSGHTANQAPRASGDLYSRAAASVADKLAILSRGRATVGEGGEDEGDGAGGGGKAMVDWKPPEGQTGDGRTALNDKLGY